MTLTSTIKRGVIVAAGVALVAAGYLVSSPQASALTALASLQSGDLIRGESRSAVYYLGEDGYRYVFPTDKVFFSWYSNFNDVKFISDADLAKVQIGGNVTYKPGTWMVKVTSRPDTYAVDRDGELRHVTSEAVASQLYGTNWNQKIHDIADGFFTNYSIGDEINGTGDYDLTRVAMNSETISEDKNLEAPEDVYITSNGFSPIDVTVEEGGIVRFINNDSTKHTASSEDLSWGTGTIQPGGSFLVRFPESGEYPFFDSYDSSNTGAVYVE